jgi:hypothetical protein
MVCEKVVQARQTQDDPQVLMYDIHALEPMRAARRIWFRPQQIFRFDHALHLVSIGDVLTWIPVHNHNVCQVQYVRRPGPQLSGFQYGHLGRLAIS